MVGVRDTGGAGTLSRFRLVGNRTLTHRRQKMGLHQLTEDPENMPPDDPAWPPGKNALKRETALRLWGYLTFFDHLAACVFRPWASSHDPS